MHVAQKVIIIHLTHSSKMNISPAAIGALMGSISQHGDNHPFVRSFLRHSTSENSDSDCEDEFTSGECMIYCCCTLLYLSNENIFCLLLYLTAFTCVVEADPTNGPTCIQCIQTTYEGVNWEAEDLCSEFATKVSVGGIV